MSAMERGPGPGSMERNSFLIQSTAGAVPVRNEKGEITMEKVKVKRYVSGKRPDYAPQSSDEEEEDDDFRLKRQPEVVIQPSASTAADMAEVDDPRLRRLLKARAAEDESSDEELDRVARHRRVLEPEVLEEADEDDEPERMAREEESSGEEDLDEEEIERRRMLMRLRARERAQAEEEVMELVEEAKEEEEEESEEESSEYEEYSDSEDEAGPRLKPVFVRKKERVTIQEREQQAQKLRELEEEAKKMAELRRKGTLKIVEDIARKEYEKPNMMEEDQFGDIDTDDDNDEEEYEAWKVRELKRIKRDREERENLEKEKMEVERMHNMTEEERRAELRSNPKQVTNKAPKGKYKFLQKYYHRGAFFMDRDSDVYKRDFAQPTLEDHFDKTILPKVMQVKNFGRSGRTKYTHLVDQDTTQFDSAWAQDSAQNTKFFGNKAGGMKQNFERPSAKKRKAKE
ncbi:microfibrillar-associated protein 1-like [Branchiostoma floridae]|uniref:Microfibrillar-associated protein 1-like n=1 Tax=Branchiostoma floridae TaxID=7739 RepID=A0A9J7ML96_BRAFL|nr:microfibrillar-associated protein 1-like [Branchiostoma floridae]